MVADDSKKLKSPFDFIQNRLCLLRRFGGYPLINNGKSGLYVSKASYPKQLVNFCLASLSSVLLVIVISTESSIDEFFSKKIFSKLDIASGFAGPIAGQISSGFLFISFVRKREELTSLLNQFAEISWLFRVEDIAKQSLRKTMRTMLTKTIFLVCNCIIFNVFIVLLVNVVAPQLRTSNPTLYWFYVLCSPVSIIFEYCDPMIISANVIIYYLIHYLKEHFSEWNSRIESQVEAQEVKCDISTNECYKTLKESIKSDFRGVTYKVDLGFAEDHILLGIKLCQLVEDLNNYLGPFLVIHMSECMIGATFTSLNCSSLFFDITKPVRITYASSFICCTLYLFLKIFFYCSAGQMLEDELHSCSKAMKLYSCKIAPILDEETKMLNKFLLERLSSSKVISPKSFFSLNHKTYVTATAAIFTYFIVLLQFRIDER